MVDSKFCIKYDTYIQFPFLKNLHDPQSTPPKDGKSCTLLIDKGKGLGDGQVLVYGLGQQNKSAVSETGEVYSNIQKSELAPDGKINKAPDASLRIAATEAMRFITAIFGAEELSDKARASYCNPTSKCERKVHDPE